MGQISLPRFNRLNVSMQWESQVNIKDYHWLSLRLYKIFKFFISTLFKALLYNFYKLWGRSFIKKQLYGEVISGFTKTTLKTHVSHIAIKVSSKKLFNILGLFLIRLLDTTYIFIAYSNFSALKKLTTEDLLIYKCFKKENFVFPYTYYNY